MELWMRSQDRKKLCKVTNLQIKTYTIYSNYGSYGQIAIFNDDIVLGDYEEERALKILDEIQRILKPAPFISPPLNSSDLLILNETVDFQELSTYVYEMPEK